MVAKVSPAYYKQDPYTTYLAGNPFADSHRGYACANQTGYGEVHQAQFCPEDVGPGAGSKNQQRTRKTGQSAYYELAKGLYQMSYWVIAGCWCIMTGAAMMACMAPMNCSLVI